MKTNYLCCHECKVYIPVPHDLALRFRIDHQDCIFRPRFQFDPLHERGLEYCAPNDDYTCVLSPVEQLCLAATPEGIQT